MKALVLMLALSATAARAELFPDLAQAAEVPSKVAYECSFAEQGIAILISTELEKVWQGFKNEEEALPMQVTEWQVARCPGCYNIIAKLDFMGQVVDYDMTTSSIEGQVRLSVTMESEGDKKTLEMDCKSL